VTPSSSPVSCNSLISAISAVSAKNFIDLVPTASRKFAYP